MVKRMLEELQAYNAPGHFGMTAMRIHGKEETQAEKFWVGLSTFLPGGGAEYAYEDNPLEKVYFMVEGQMTVTDKEGKKYVLNKGDSISFQPNEGRYLIATQMHDNTLEVVLVLQGSFAEMIRAGGSGLGGVLNASVTRQLT